MRRPISWDDITLLEDEPLRSCLHACSATDSGRRGRLSVLERLKVLVEDIKIEQGGAEAVRAWLDFAFARSDPDDPTDEIPLDNHGYTTFINFYWKLYEDDKPDVFLQQERRRIGYAFLPQSGDDLERVIVTERTNGTEDGRIGPRQDIEMPSLRLTSTIEKQSLKNRSREKPDRKPPTPPVVPSLHKSVPGRCSNTSSLPKGPRTPKLPHQPKRGRGKVINGRYVDELNRPSTNAELHVLDQALEAWVADDLLGKLCPSQSIYSPHQQSHTPIKPEILDAHIKQIPLLHPSETPPIRATTKPSHTCEPSACEVQTPGMDSTSNVELVGVGVPIAPDISIIPDVVPNVPVQVKEAQIAYDTESLAISNCPPPRSPAILSPYKPPLPNFPPIWAQSRQEVCESFDWFRSYQSGVYHSQNIVKGYLLSAFSSCRDAFEHEGRLIISHGGGKAESLHSRRGQITTQPADDQLAQDKSVRALLKTYRDRRPLVLLIDDKYTLFPYDLGAKNVTYAVLGFYTIEHAWAEYQPANNERGHVIRYKFAFQWCHGQGEPWWIPSRDATPDTPMGTSILSDDQAVKANKLPALVKVTESDHAGSRSLGSHCIYIPCVLCHEESPWVYRQQWACLNAECAKFWFPLGQVLSLLEYNPAFLRLSAPFVLPPTLSEIRPEPPVSSSPNGVTTTYAFTRGWHCIQCGRLSCRFKWEHWECSHCHSIVKISGRIRSSKNFWMVKVPVLFHSHFVMKSSGIKQEPVRLYKYKNGHGQLQTFILPYQRGRIHHIRPGENPLGNVDADTIFREYQEQAASGRLAFRRWPLRSHKCRGPLLTNYFSQNSGEPYQYVGGTANTVSFKDAPSAVLDALGLIQERICQALGVGASFNEVLSAAYMERQKMAFHSDSEPGLGPLIAGLSLGSPALIHFRLHSKHQKTAGEDQKGIAISFVLRHGDILAMDGAAVQEYYEHTVVPTNFRIAATARNINPVSI